MPVTSGATLEDHLQRFANSSDAGDEESDFSERDTCGREREASHQGKSEDSSFLSLMFADSSAARGTIVANVRQHHVVQALMTWWERYHPAMLKVFHHYRNLLLDFFAPFTPCGARRAGYFGACDSLLRSLDLVDSKIPGGEREWSSRWRSRVRPDQRGPSFAQSPLAVDATVSGVGVGVAAAAVMFAAASWCSWRRSPPGWPLLLAEMACGSACAAHIIAKEDGRREAKLFAARLMSLEHSLGPFFRSVDACTRMVRCSQALSFGLRLSIPMPPVARMEGGDISGGARGVGSTLRDVRCILVDVLDGGIRQTRAREVKDGGEKTSHFAQSGPDSRGVRSTTRQGPEPLSDISRAGKQLNAELRSFVAEVATRMQATLADTRDHCGLWWESQLAGISDAVLDLAAYFAAAAERLETTVSPTETFVPPSEERPQSGTMIAAAEGLSQLRLRYEESLVRIFTCQNTVSSVLRDPAGHNAEAWLGVRRELEQARAAVERCGGGHVHGEVWQRVEGLIDSLAAQDAGAEPDASPDPPEDSQASQDTSRQLEAGVGWVSLATPREEDPGVFEGGSGDADTDETTTSRHPDEPEKRVTDVLVGVSSPKEDGQGTERGGDARTGSDGVLFDDERSRLELVGELDSVLRSRPVLPTCEKHLPLESQPGVPENEQHGGGGGDELPPSTEGLEELAPPSEPLVVNLPLLEDGGTSRDLMSELRAQLSMAANEEIFSSDRSRHTVESQEQKEDVQSPRSQGQDVPPLLGGSDRG